MNVFKLLVLYQLHHTNQDSSSRGVPLGEQILLFCLHTVFILSLKQSKKNVSLWRWRHYNLSAATCPTTHVTSQKTCIFSSTAVITSYLYYIMYFSFHIPPSPNGVTVPSGPGTPHYRGFTMTPRHTTHVRQDSSGWVISQMQRLLTTLSTHKRQTSMPPAGLESTIRASERAAADRHVRPYDRWDPPLVYTLYKLPYTMEVQLRLLMYPYWSQVCKMFQSFSHLKETS